MLKINGIHLNRHIKVNSALRKNYKEGLGRPRPD